MAFSARDRERAKNALKPLIEKCCRHYSYTRTGLCAAIFDENTQESTVRSKVLTPADGKTGLTADSLLEIIKQLKKIDYDNILTPEDIQWAFLELVQMTAQERENIGLNVGDNEVLFQQFLLNRVMYINKVSSQQNDDAILELYKTSIGLDFTNGTPRKFQNLEEIDSYIDELLDLEKSSYQLPYLSLPISHKITEKEKREEVRKKKITVLAETVKKQVRRILRQCGTGQTRFITRGGEQKYITKYLTKAFIDRLTQAIVENSCLEEAFPVYIQAVDIEKLAPFPLTTSESQGNYALLNQELLQMDQHDSSCADAAALPPHRVTVHFYLRLNKKLYQDLIKESESVQNIAWLEKKEGGREIYRIDFKLSSTGIGGIMSHITKVINNALLSDVDGLRDKYFPIAHDVTINQEIIRNKVSSPIWSHCVVKLCRQEAVRNAMQSSNGNDGIRSYEKVASAIEVGRGDYCGFNSLLSDARAALYARLRAIQHTGIKPQIYLKDLYCRIERQRLLEEARSCVRNYPYSSFAQERRLQASLLKSSKLSLKSHHSYSFIDACLTLAETYLSEGTYRKAKIYLIPLDQDFEEYSQQGIKLFRNLRRTEAKSVSETQESKFEIISGALIVRYELCTAEYHYLFGKSLKEDEHGDNRESQINSAWKALNRAEEHLTIRMAKYVAINEASQSTFHPHYFLLAHIYFLRARIFFFFPELLSIDRTPEHTVPTDHDCDFHRKRELPGAIHGGRLYLLEKARLYASNDGARDLYSCCTAFQCWAYLMAAMETPVSISTSEINITLNRETCLDWACRLRDHALSAYAEIGQRYYYQIKEKSGVFSSIAENNSKSINYLTLDNYKIQHVPAIREIIGSEKRIPGIEGTGPMRILYLDMVLLSLRRRFLRATRDSGDPDERIYLFGPQASYLFFARGMYHLCSDAKKEFQDSIKDLKDSSLKVELPKEWESKLEQAYHLFSYAWGIAEDGGTVSGNSEAELAIERPFTFNLSEKEDSNLSPDLTHAQTMRDLYPLRITEIADLGRLFAAACAVLRAYTLKALGRPIEPRWTEAIWLLGGLHRPDHCTTLNTWPPGIAVEERLNKSPLCGQEKYNEHLENHLQHCRERIEAEYRMVLETEDIDGNLIREKRETLIRDLFRELRFGISLSR